MGTPRQDDPHPAIVEAIKTLHTGLASTLGDLNKSVVSLVDAIRNLGKTPSPDRDKPKDKKDDGGLTKQLTDVLNRFLNSKIDKETKGFGDLGKLLGGGGKGSGGLGEIAPAEGAAGGEAAEAAAGLGAAATGVGIAVAAVIGSLALLQAAVSTVIGTLDQLTSTIKPFVEAFSPGTVLLLNQALRDLQATVGYALVPVAQVLTDVFRQTAGILLPFLTELRPLLAQLAESLGGALVAGLRTFVAGLTALLPAAQLVVDLVSELADVLADLWAVVAVLVRTFADLLNALLAGLGSGLTLLLKGMGDALKESIKGLVFFAATLLKVAGANETLARLIANFQRLRQEAQERAGGLVAAPDSPAVKDAQAIARDAALAAFAAQGAGEGKAKSQEEFLGDIVKGLEAIRETDTSLGGVMREVGRQIVEAIKESLPGRAKDVLDVGRSTVAGAAGLGLAGGVLGAVTGAVSGLLP